MAPRTLQSGHFHGIGRTTRECAGLVLTERDYDPHHRLPLHAHEQPFFSLVLRGAFSERHDLGRRECLPTSIVFYPEQEPHTEEFDEGGGRCFNIELSDAWLAPLRNAGMRYGSGSVATRASRLNWLATRLYTWCNREGNDCGADELVTEMLAEVCDARGMGREREAPPWLDRVRDLLEAHLPGRVRVTELAAEAGVHPVHLARVFRRHFGCTIGQYVQRARVERACRALVEGDDSLSTIAYATGFTDQSHLTRRFKELTGMPPGAYRSLLAG